MKPWTQPTLFGLLASALLLGVYFTILTLVSGFEFAWSQWQTYWYFISSLAAGFGVQVGLYAHLRYMVHAMNMRTGAGAVAMTGTTSTLSMISCCAHYMVNVVPVLGITGALTLVAQYQIEIFWVGLAFNLSGILFISNKIIKFKKEHEQQ